MSCLVIFLTLAARRKEKPIEIFNFFVLIILVILLVLFKTNRILLFFITFELTLIPITLLVLGWGYQPERLSAAYSLLLYTIVASLPLLISVVILIKHGLLNTLNTIFADQGSYCPNVLTIIILISFLVKFPIYIVHLWLPKAHVEAPVGGSIILAAILLKIGGVGMVIFYKLFFSSLVKTIMCVRLGGGVIVSILCISLTDSKTLIAYSSVAHMRLAIRALISGSQAGTNSGLFLIVAHGFASSLIFLGAFQAYKLFNTRNMLLIRALTSYFPRFSLIWFLACAGNMGAPPSFNLLAEIFRSVSVVSFIIPGIIFLILTLFFSVVFRLLLYTQIATGSSSYFSASFSQTRKLDLFLILWHLFRLIFIYSLISGII